MYVATSNLRHSRNVYRRMGIATLPPRNLHHGPARPSSPVKAAPASAPAPAPAPTPATVLATMPTLPPRNLHHGPARPSSPVLKGLGDTCWLDSKTGAQVCGAGDPTGETSCATSGPYYTPQSKLIAPDGTTWTFSLSGNTISAAGRGGSSKWTFVFLYHAGYTDVYKRASGADCRRSNFPCDFIQVTQQGQVSFLGTAPAQLELGCSNITTATASQTPGANTYATTSSVPVYTGGPQGWPTSSPYVQTPVASTTPAPSASGFSLSSLPTWAYIAAASVGGLLLLPRVMGKR